MIPPADFDLVSLSAVKTAMRTPNGNSALDEQLQQSITAASKAVLLWSGREFAPVTEATRKVQWDGRQYVNFQPWDLQEGEVSYQGRKLQEGTDFRFLPVEQFQGTFTHLEMAQRAEGPWAVLEIEGTWGFPAVPSDVAQAVIVAVMAWSRRDVGAMSINPPNREPGQPLPEQPQSYDLPLASKRLLQPYRRSHGGIW